MELGRMLKALGEPMRYRIYYVLLERKYCVYSLFRKFGVWESAISQHMKVMRNASLVLNRDMTVCQCEYRKEGE